MNLYTVRARTVEALEVKPHASMEEVCDFAPAEVVEQLWPINPGDFIVKDTFGRFSVVPGEVFLATYDPVGGGRHR